MDACGRGTTIYDAALPHCTAGRAHPTNLSCAWGAGGLDVGVQAEEIGRVVLRFHAHQARIVLAKGRAHALVDDLRVAVDVIAASEGLQAVPDRPVRLLVGLGLEAPCPGVA